MQAESQFLPDIAVFLTLFRIEMAEEGDGIVVLAPTHHELSQREGIVVVVGQRFQHIEIEWGEVDELLAERVEQLTVVRIGFEQTVEVVDIAT